MRRRKGRRLQPTQGIRLLRGGRYCSRRGSDRFVWVRSRMGFAALTPRARWSSCSHAATFATGAQPWQSSGRRPCSHGPAAHRVDVRRTSLVDRRSDDGRQESKIQGPAGTCRLSPGLHRRRLLAVLAGAPWLLGSTAGHLCADPSPSNTLESAEAVVHQMGISWVMAKPGGMTLPSDSRSLRLSSRRSGSVAAVADCAMSAAAGTTRSTSRSELASAEVSAGTTHAIVSGSHRPSAAPSSKAGVDSARGEHVPHAAEQLDAPAEAGLRTEPRR